MLPLLVLLRLEGGEVPLRVRLEGGEPFPNTAPVESRLRSLGTGEGGGVITETEWARRGGGEGGKIGSGVHWEIISEMFDSQRLLLL